MTSRLRPPPWQHDAYPLRQLAARLVPLVRRLFMPRAGVTVVDFGCGDAPYRPLFDALGARYVGCDLAGSAAPVMFNVDDAVPVADGAADGVVSFQVLEHVWNLPWYLGEAHRMLRDDGVLLLSTHGVWPYHPHPGDFRRWTRPGLVREIEAHGFQVAETYAIVGPLAWTLLFQCMALGALLRKVPLVGPGAAAALALITNPCLALADAITPAAWAAQNASIYLIVASKDSTHERV